MPTPLRAPCTGEAPTAQTGARGDSRQPEVVLLESFSPSRAPAFHRATAGAPYVGIHATQAQGDPCLKAFELLSGTGLPTQPGPRSVLPDALRSP